jgi:molybdopterin-guanine dinucleotide biosynthesis protein A
MEFDAVVPAGGRGSRLGGADKALVEIGSTTLLERALTAAASASQTIIVGPERPVSRRALFTREHPAGGGPVHALAAGLALVRAERTVVLAADLPFASGATIERLLDGIGNRDGAVAVDAAGRAQFLLAAYRTEPLREAIKGMRSTVDAAMRELVAGMDLARVLDAAAAFDCDTWDDVAAARAALETARP